MAELSLNLDQVAWPVLLVDTAGVVRRANQTAQRLFGPKLAGGAPLLASIWGPENSLTPVQCLAQARKSPAGLFPLKLRGPHPVSIPFSASLGEVSQNGETFLLIQLLPGGGAGSSALSGTDAKGPTVEANLAQKQKLDCALQLTRTVTLDFNNSLTTILGHASHLLSLAEPKHPWRVSLVEIEKAASRGAEIANHLAAFSSEEKDSRSRAAGNLNNLVRRTMELFQTPQNALLSWVLQLENKLFGVKYDEAKIQQAIVKVTENAVQAVKADGRIVVQTRNIELSEPTQDRTAQLKPGTYVCLEVSDDGCGIEPAVLPRVFEPFFTTKYGHRGLGLAWVYGIVTNHGGGVAISSQLGQGSAVRIYLPAVKKIIEEKAIADGVLGGQQSILVVDDEEMVLTMAQMVLSSHGYNVMTASSGEKALEVMARSQTQVDLLVTDMVMPGMNGRELIEKVRASSPATRIVCSTGCSPAQAGGGEVDFLLKPFTSQQLLRKVKETLTS
ncbi:MAG: response regulator [Verrucomicrobia bacterium]|nr:response regulator [Verrucomicrobiota bacterium]